MIKIIDYKGIYEDQVINIIDKCNLSKVSKEGLNRNSDNTCSFIALSDGQVVGFIYGTFGADCGYIRKLCVDTDYRRLGIARKLMKKIELFFKNNRNRFILIPAYEKNKEAKEFYLSQDCYERPLIVFRKDL